MDLPADYLCTRMDRAQTPPWLRSPCGVAGQGGLASTSDFPRHSPSLFLSINFPQSPSIIRTTQSNLYFKSRFPPHSSEAFTPPPSEAFYLNFSIVILNSYSLKVKGVTIKSKGGGALVFVGNKLLF